MRCQPCHDIPLSLFLDLGAYDHSDSYELLDMNAAKCDLCSLLLLYMDEVLNSRTPEYAEKIRKSDMKIYLEHVAHGSTRSIQLKFRGLEDTAFPELRFHSDQLPPKGSKWMWELPADKLEALQGEMNSSECIDLAKKWIQNCTEDHPECQGTSSGWLPTRVIEVGSADRDPRLIITSENASSSQNASYLALSHCWGGGPHDELHMTKTNTLSARLAEIPFSSLPNTFRDAIIIARYLQVPYLWIDTFCIIQDSKEDWEHEAASMFHVYSEALCTIAASSSINWKGGCFVPRNKTKTSSCNLSWPRLDDGITNEDISLTIFPPLPSDTLDTCPLGQRAWALQERRISRRILFYTDIQLQWECHSWAATESGPVGYPRIPMRGHNVVGHGKARHETWRKTVKEYSNMQLTFWTDRLTALSGLAMQTEMALNGEQYLAGLWRGDLTRDLLWYRPHWFEPLKQSSEYLAPTWSWASRIGTVSTPVFRNILGDEFIDVGSGPKILAAEITLAGKNAFSQVTSGALRLSGCLREAIAKTRDTDHPGSDFEYPLFEKESEQIRGNFTFDCEAEPSTEPLYLLRMATIVRPERDYGQFLVMGLHLTGHADEEYERCGLGEIIDTHWFDQCEQKNIAII